MKIISASQILHLVNQWHLDVRDAEEPCGTKIPPEQRDAAAELMKYAAKLRVEEATNYLEYIQDDVAGWVLDTFGPEIADDRTERNNRFMEEAIELVQANGMSKQAILDLVEFVYNKEPGELSQEIGGAFITLTALVEAAGEHFPICLKTEMDRISNPECQKRIIEKQKTKPRFEPSEVYPEREDYRAKK